MHKYKKNKAIYFLFLLTFLITNDVFSFSFKKNQNSTEENTCQINGMAGKFPKEISKIINNLKMKNDRETSSINMKNRLLLYGPPGNGKSTIAKKIAELSGCKFEHHISSAIINRYIGTGSNRLSEIVDNAVRLAERTGKVVVIFFDEIDNIAKSNKDAESIDEYENTISALWQLLDMHKDNPRLYFIFATNKFDKLEKRFVNRLGAKAIEIPNPDKQQREEVLRYYVNKYGLTSFINESLFTKILDKTNSLCSRSLEDFIQELKENKNELESNKDLIWESLNKIKKTAIKEKSEFNYDKWLSRLYKSAITINYMIIIYLTIFHHKNKSQNQAQVYNEELSKFWGFF